MKEDPPRQCEVCGKTLTRKRFGLRIEDRTRFLARRHCGQSCGNTREVISLAGHRARARKHRGRVCADCGATEDFHAHHWNEDVTDNREENIVTLCATCHISGHWERKRHLSA